MNEIYCIYIIILINVNIYILYIIYKMVVVFFLVLLYCTVPGDRVLWYYYSTV